MSTTWLFGLAALVVAGAIAAALFGLPVRTWFDQDSELQALEHELTEMQSVNHDLQGEVDRLQTDDGIREAARDELGLVQSGDNRQTMLELPPLPTDLPTAGRTRRSRPSSRCAPPDAPPRARPLRRHRHLPRRSPLPSTTVAAPSATACRRPLRQRRPRAHRDVIHGE